MVLADTALLDSLTLEAQLPFYWVPVLGSLYILILSAVSITQEPTRWVPGLLGLVKFLLALPAARWHVASSRTLRPKLHGGILVGWVHGVQKRSTGL